MNDLYTSRIEEGYQEVLIIRHLLYEENMFSNFDFVFGEERFNQKSIFHSHKTSLVLDNVTTTIRTRLCTAFETVQMRSSALRLSDARLERV